MSENDWKLVKGVWRPLGEYTHDVEPATFKVVVRGFQPPAKKQKVRSK